MSTVNYRRSLPGVAGLETRYRNLLAQGNRAESDECQLHQLAAILAIPPAQVERDEQAMRRIIRLFEIIATAADRHECLRDKLQLLRETREQIEKSLAEFEANAKEADDACAELNRLAGEFPRLFQKPDGEVAA